ncbi:MAG: hypothetical protein ACHP65_08825 [Legionellales bacterium]
MIDKLERLHVVSLDFDGCINHNPRWYEKMLLQELGHDPSHLTSFVDANKPFLEQIKREGQRHQKQIVFIGSNRQSHRQNQRELPAQGESCFDAISSIAVYLNAELNTLLSADLEHGLSEGLSFRRAMDKGYKGVHTQVLGDSGTKVSLLYAQMHNIANKYPDAKIQFDFFDDVPGILQYLSEFYSSNSHLIPNNVTMCLNHYYDAIPPQAPNFTLQGTGYINKYYVLCKRKIQEKMNAMGDIFKPAVLEPSEKGVDAYSKFNPKFVPLLKQAFVPGTNVHALVCATPVLCAWQTNAMAKTSSVPDYGHSSQLGLFSASAEIGAAVKVFAGPAEGCFEGCW